MSLINIRYSLSATQSRYRFEYTRHQSDVLRPLILVQLRHAGQMSYAVPAIIDTGSDRCMFDHELALSIGMNPYQDGQEAEAVGIGGAERIAVAPIELVIPAFEGQSWRIFAQFKRLPEGAPAILGHAGFLGRTRATFTRGREFELAEIKLD